jgi:hypothetical protein
LALRSDKKSGEYVPRLLVTFLETSVYSIKNWNESKGHKDPNVFVEQDENLSKQIYTLNGKVREINNSLAFLLGTGYEYDGNVFVAWVLQVRRAEVVTK